MNKVEINEKMKLSEHFTLGELTKTSYITADGNIPSHKAIENLKNLCENWLEDLRYSQNTLYGDKNGDIPIIISSGYRSEEVNRLCGGAKGSNHLTGCAVDIKCYGPEQMIRMAGILLDISDGTKRDFDELIHYLLDSFRGKTQRQSSEDPFRLSIIVNYVKIAASEYIY